MKIQRPVRTDDAYGGAAVEWEDVADVWAGIVPMSDRERFLSHQISPLATHKVSIRFNGKIAFNQSWRILYGSRSLKIIGILNIDERRREWQVTCEEEPS